MGLFEPTNYVNFFLSLISLQEIWSLAWFLKGPGIAAIILLFLRAAKAAYSMLPSTVVTSIAYALILAVTMTKFGEGMQNMVLVQLSSL